MALISYQDHHMWLLTLAGPPPFFVLRSHATLIELRLVALISYQDHRMLLLILAGRLRWHGDARQPVRAAAARRLHLVPVPLGCELYRRGGRRLPLPLPAGLVSISTRILG